MSRCWFLLSAVWPLAFIAIVDLGIFEVFPNRTLQSTGRFVGPPQLGAGRKSTEGGWVRHDVWIHIKYVNDV